MMIFCCLYDSGPLQDRRPLAAQRRLADAAQARIVPPAGLGAPDVVSRTHSRRWSGAAHGWRTLDVGAVPALGVDIEFIDPRRPWAQIAERLGLAADTPAACACRAWTVMEAWFKAFGQLPGPDVLETAIAGAPDGQPAALGGDAYAASWRLAGGFVASAVWRGTRSAPDFICEAGAPGAPPGQSA